MTATCSLCNEVCRCGGAHVNPAGRLGAMIPVFDGHNDTLLLQMDKPGREFFARNEDGHIDFVRAREGGFAGGFFAVFPPNPPYEGVLSADPEPAPDSSRPRFPTYGPVEFAAATRAAQSMASILFRLEAASHGKLKVALQVDDLASNLEQDVMSAILHFEGAEAIGPDLDGLELYRRAGLRSLGIVWSRPNIFGHGVPFAYPSGPDTGPGLTKLGRELVRRCNRLGIMVDLSHITERGFWDVAETTDAPLVATHSNAHAVCPSARNLTDAQLDAIAESDGMVGLNFAVGFLDPEGKHDADLPVEVMVRHVDHLVERLSIDRVGFGSDFDGATIPAAIKDVAGLQVLVDALKSHGYDEPSLRKLAHENWFALLGRTWKD